MPKKVFCCEKFSGYCVNSIVTVIGNSDGELMESYLCMFICITQIGFCQSVFLLHKKIINIKWQKSAVYLINKFGGLK